RYVCYCHYEQRSRPRHLDHPLRSRMAGVRRAPAAAGQLAARSDQGRSARRDAGQQVGSLTAAAAPHLRIWNQESRIREIVRRRRVPNSQFLISPTPTGNTISNTVFSGSLTTEIVPPCRSTIAFTIDSPSPLPPET